MAKVKIELNREGVREVLRSTEMLKICEKQAEKIKNRVGDEYAVTTKTEKNRVHANVETATFSAMAREPKDHTLLKALR